MTDTVNVTRELLQGLIEQARFDEGCMLCGEHEELLGEASAALAVAQKAEPVSEAVRLSLETANYLERIAEEADDNQWQDWAATMRQAAGQMRRLCSAQPEAPKVEQEPVAWLITNKASGVKDLSFRKLADFPFNHSRFESEPLYAHHAPFSGELYEALVDLASWFTRNVQGLDGQVWAIPAGEHGADDALEVARRIIAKHKGPQS